MKKLISCLLAVLLVCSLMSMSVFADRVVGNTGSNPAINDGVNDPAYSGAEKPINVQFGQKTDPDTGESDTGNTGVGEIIVHRYAVDITYGDLTLDLTKLNFQDVPVANENGTPEPKDLYMVWDVNEYKYVLCYKTEENNVVTYTPVELVDVDNGEQVDAKNETDSAVLTQGIELNGTIYVTNHSDLSVYTTLTLTPNRSDIDWLIKDTEDTGFNGNGTTTANIENTPDANGSLVATQTITKATAVTTDPDTGNETEGSATNGSEYKFTATPATTMSNGWIDVVGNLINGNVATIGTITVTIAANAPTANP